MKFSEYVLLTEGKDERRLSVYKCPFCNKNEAYNGEPGSGFTFRGSAKCAACGKSFSAMGQTPVSNEGPLIGESPASREFAKMCRKTDQWFKDQGLR